MARVLVVIMAQQKHVDRVVQEIRDEDPAALVEMEERTKRPQGTITGSPAVGTCGPLNAMLERKVCAAPLVAFTTPAKVR